MTVTVLPFPIVQRRAFIAKQAEQMACMNDGAAARYLQHQLQTQREAMRRRGIADDLIEIEIRNMETAIRREFQAVTGAA